MSDQSAIELSHWPRTLHIERGGVRRLGEFVERLGARRALVVCGRTVASGSMLDRVKAGLGPLFAGVYDKAAAHTPLVSVIDGAKVLRALDADIVISVGGGSTIDSAKAMAVFAAVGEDVEDYKVRPRVAQKPLPAAIVPHIAVPTVPGSGSEIQPNAGVLDPATHTKFRFRDPVLVPRLALLDAEMVALCGPELTASTGIGAVARCVEALYSRHRNPIADALALHGLRLLVRTLPLGITRPDDLDAREQCQCGSIMSAMATANAEVSLVHSVGLVVGGHYQLPHGIAHGIVLPAAIRAFLPLLGANQSAVLAALGGTPGDATAAANDAADRVVSLARALNLQPLLRDVGIKQNDLPKLADEASRLPMMANVPRAVDSAELTKMLMSVW